MIDRESVIAAYWNISQGAPEEGVLRLLIELGGQFVGAAEGSLLVLDDDKSELVFAMTAGSKSSETLIGQRVPIGAGITGLAAQTREVQIGAPTFNTNQPKKPEHVLSAPMLVNDEIIGVITAVSFDLEKRFNRDDAMLYGRIATVAALVVQQQQNIAALEAVQAGGKLPDPISEDEQLDRQIIEMVQKVLHSSPDVKSQVVGLLSAVVSLVEK